MFLYPLWIIITGIFFAFLSVKLIKNNTLALCVSFLSTLSSFVFFLVYLSFTGPLSISYFQHFIVFELNAFNVFFCLLAVGVTLLVLFVYPSFMGVAMHSEVIFITLCMFFLSLGSMLSSGIYSFILFFELTFLFFLPLAKSKGGSNDFSLFDYSVYFTPTVLFVAGVLASYLGNREIHEIKLFHMTIYTRIFFIIAFSLRLFCFPLAFSLQRMIEMSSKPSFIYGLIITLITVCSSLIKFFRVDSEFAFAMMIVSVIFMIIWSVYAFRQKEVKDMVMFSYAVQTAFLGAALAMMFFDDQLRTYFYWIFLNHIVSGLGVLVYRPMVTTKRGGPAHIIYMVILFSLSGFFPSMGLLGRWIFLQSHTFPIDWFSLFAISILLVNLSSITYHLKWIPALWKNIHVDNEYKMSLQIKCFYASLLFFLFGPLCFVRQLNRFFLLISS